MSTIIPEKCNLIVNGFWNTAIIKPNWLVKEFPTLVPKAFDVLYDTEFSTMRFDIKSIYFEPNNSYLRFVPKQLNEETLDFISNLNLGIQTKLQYTPVVSAGCNFVFNLDENEEFNIENLNILEESNPAYDKFGLEALVEKKTQHTFSFPNYQLNIIYKIDVNNKSIQYNYHYDRTSQVELIKHYSFSENLNKTLLRLIK